MTPDQHYKAYAVHLARPDHVLQWRRDPDEGITAVAVDTPLYPCLIFARRAGHEQGASTARTHDAVYTTAELAEGDEFHYIVDLGHEQGEPRALYDTAEAGTVAPRCDRHLERTAGAIRRKNLLSHIWKEIEYTWEGTIGVI